MSTRKRICMVAYTIYLWDARVRREAETLAALPGYEVTVMALREGNSRPKRYIKDGVQVRDLGMYKYQGNSTLRYFLSYLRFIMLSFCACTKLFMTGSIDVYHIHNMPNSLIFAAILPRLFGKKVVLDIHDTMIETYASKFQGWASRLMGYVFKLEEEACCALAHRIICVNDVQRDTLVGRGIPREKTVISMNIPDPKHFSRGQTPFGRQANDCFRLVYFGTISRRLGIDLAIRAVAKLDRRIPGMEFHILGIGDDKDEFIKLTKELGADHLVRFYNRVCPLEELSAILDRMDVGIVPNRKNPATELMLPVKMLESVALGIPVIVPRLRGITHYFTDDMVFFFEADDVASLADTIIESYKDKNKRAQKAERAMAFLDKYGWETHKVSLLELYCSM